MSNGTPLEAGKLVFYNNFPPALEPGDYSIDVSQSITIDNQNPNGTPFTAKQDFTVDALRFHLDPNLVQSHYPPAKTAGSYGLHFAHIVLYERTVPWARKLTNATSAKVRAYLGWRSCCSKKVSWYCLPEYLPVWPTPRYRTP